ncbi:anthranilate synthase component I [Aeropyrum pernix K1]|uniref:Anthranilate synthase component 1 n=1 Tax=Aeropyrum pernix (strain ATCC 700893 / DSM 11879 / JCM 9820 / NBRC 100138 / K1) TaxID=272557 RepID=TRPE_AERPE|nr:anthranilate synthase component I family protein [Aeropyrum pernix]Q9Y8T0.2 RecName: Full=Anthranilate synthase component 1; Short=AS; Short=ASI [Aeropyrum pernix K1]BAA81570.2 anthranilate synthase component I [Aeropyrum pernix K1]
MPSPPEPPLHWRDCRLEPILGFPRPRELAKSLEVQGEEWIALLESGGGLQHRSRYSFLAWGRRKSSETDAIRAYEELERLADDKCRALPCRSPTFFLVSYEAVVGEEPWLSRLVGRHEWPGMTAFSPEYVVVYDHAGGRVSVCPGDTPLPAPASRKESFSAEGPTYETSRKGFEAMVADALERIRAGEAFQVVLSRVERYRVWGSLFSAYERLADANPSPYLYYARLGGRVIIGSSPELLVKLEAGRVETHPIAGTRPRGSTPIEDIELEVELLNDEKERAEHVMLVDLARNDITRVSIPGTVQVTSFMDIERYETVMHIVSRVEGVTRPSTTFVEALKALHPAGTVSGAPKPRAMEIIAELEEEARGPYAGAIGVAGSSAGEAAIVLRSAWLLDDGETLEARAGAGIVYDSKPEREYMETVQKLGSLKRALGVDMCG